jgi:hypothetical protein
MAWREQGLFLRDYTITVLSARDNIHTPVKIGKGSQKLVPYLHNYISQYRQGQKGLLTWSSGNFYFIKGKGKSRHLKFQGNSFGLFPELASMPYRI